MRPRRLHVTELKDTRFCELLVIFSALGLTIWHLLRGICWFFLGFLSKYSKRNRAWGIWPSCAKIVWACAAKVCYDCSFFWQLFFLTSPWSMMCFIFLLCKSKLGLAMVKMLRISSSDEIKLKGTTTSVRKCFPFNNVLIGAYSVAANLGFRLRSFLLPKQKRWSQWWIADDPGFLAMCACYMAMGENRLQVTFWEGEDPPKVVYFKGFCVRRATGVLTHCHIIAAPLVASLWSLWSWQKRRTQKEKELEISFFPTTAKDATS